MKQRDGTRSRNASSTGQSRHTSWFGGNVSRQGSTLNGDPAPPGTSTSPTRSRPTRGVSLSLPPEVAPDADARKSQGLERKHRSAVEGAVSLYFLQRFAADVEALEGGLALTTEQVVQRYILPRTAGPQCRYVDHVQLVDEEHLNTPTFYVCHAWGNSFGRLMSSLSSHLSGANPRHVFLFIDIFAVNQHPNADRSHDIRVLDAAVDASTSTVVVMDDKAALLERCWCLYEIWSTLMGKGPQAVRVLYRGGVAGLAHLDKSLVRSIDIASAATTNPADKIDLLASTSGSEGSAGLEASSLRVRLALLLLLPPEHNSRPQALRDRTRSPSGLSHLSTVRTDTYQEWLDLDTASSGFRCLAITGKPASGKSTVAASLLARKPAMRPHVSFFCQSSDQSSTQPLLAIRSIAYQLGLLLPAMGHELVRSLTMLDVLRLTEVEAAFEALLLRPLLKLFSTLPALVPGNMSEVARRLVLAPGTATPRKGVIVLIDGLDEAGRPDEAQLPSDFLARNRLLWLVKELLPQLPRLFRVVLTLPSQADSPALLRCIAAAWTPQMELVSELQHAQQCMTVIGERLMQLMQDKTQTGAAVQVIYNDKGPACPLLYAEVVVANLREVVEERKELHNEAERGIQARDIDKLPDSLHALYTVVSRRRRAIIVAASKPSPEEGLAAQKLLLQLIVAAREPVPLVLLESLGLADSLPSLPCWGTLFYARDGRVHALHRSVLDWLVTLSQSGDFYIDAHEAHLAWCRISPVANAEDRAELKLPKAQQQQPPPQQALTGSNGPALSVAPVQEPNKDPGAWAKYFLRYGMAHACLVPRFDQLGELAGNLDMWRAVFEEGILPFVLSDLEHLAPRGWALCYDLLRWANSSSDYLTRIPRASRQLAQDCPSSTLLSGIARDQLPKPCARLANPLDSWQSWEWQALAVRPHADKVTCIDWSVDSSMIATGSRDGLVELRTPGNGRLIMTLSTDLTIKGSIPARGSGSGTAAAAGASAGSGNTGSAAAAPDAAAAGAAPAAEASGGGAAVPGGVAVAGGNEAGSDGASLAGGEAASTASPVAAAAAAAAAVAAAGAANDDDDDRDSAPAAVAAVGVVGVVGVWFVRSPQGGAADAFGAWGFGVQLLAAVASDGASSSVLLWDAISGIKLCSLHNVLDVATSSVTLPDGWHMEARGALANQGIALTKVGPKGHPRQPIGVLIAPAPSAFARERKALKALPELRFTQATCAAASLSRAALACGFSDGSVRLWSRKNVDVLAARAAAGGLRGSAAGPDSDEGEEEGEQEEDGASVQSEVKVAPQPGFPAPALGAAAAALAARAEADEEARVLFEAERKRSKAAVDSLPYVSRWDSKTGHRMELMLKGQLEGRAKQLLFSPDSSQLVAAGEDRILRVIDRQSGVCMAELRGHECAISQLCFNPSGQMLASSGEDGSLLLWALPECTRVAALRHPHEVTCIAFHPDGGSYLACGLSDGNIYIWIMHALQRPLRVFEGHASCVRAMAFAPGGSSTLASGSADETLRLFDCVTSACDAVLEGHTAEITVVVFARQEQQLLLTASKDHTIRTWACDKLGKWGPRAELRGLAGPIWHAAFSPDGRQVLGISAIAASSQKPLSSSAGALGGAEALGPLSPGKGGLWAVVAKGAAAGVHSLAAAAEAAAAAAAEARNAIVWDLASGTKLAGYVDVLAAAWWPAAPADGPGQKTLVAAGGRADDWWFAVATPNLLQVLPAPRVTAYSSEPVAEAYYDVPGSGVRGPIVLGPARRGAGGICSFAFAEGTRVRVYNLCTPPRAPDQQPPAPAAAAAAAGLSGWKLARTKGTDHMGPR